MKNPADNEKSANKITNTTVCVALFVVLSFNFGTWILLKILPLVYSCYFRDNFSLRMLWPPNIVIFSQIKAAHYSQRDECLFFASRSLDSVCWAAFFLWLGCSLRKIRYPDLHDKAIENFRKHYLIFFAISFLLPGFLIFFDNFDDDFSGSAAWFAFHTYDSLAWIVVKTNLRMFLIYSIILMWVLIIKRYWQRSVAN